MPSKSEAQRKYIFYLRSKDSDKSKWFWDKDWETIKEDHVERYTPFDFSFENEDHPDPEQLVNESVLDEDEKQTDEASIESMQKKIKNLRDKLSREDLNFDAKQRIKNQINQVQNQIVKKKDQIQNMNKK